MLDRERYSGMGDPCRAALLTICRLAWKPGHVIRSRLDLPTYLSGIQIIANETQSEARCLGSSRREIMRRQYQQQ